MREQNWINKDRIENWLLLSSLTLHMKKECQFFATPVDVAQLKEHNIPEDLQITMQVQLLI